MHLNLVYIYMLHSDSKIIAIITWSCTTIWGSYTWIIVTMVSSFVMTTGRTLLVAKMAWTVSRVSYGTSVWSWAVTRISCRSACLATVKKYNFKISFMVLLKTGSCLILIVDTEWFTSKIMGYCLLQPLLSSRWQPLHQSWMYWRFLGWRTRWRLLQLPLVDQRCFPGILCYRLYVLYTCNEKENMYVI